ncbi:MAG: GNAT family N-acetyltransferase [Aquaticitalea sp.]
MVHFSIYTTVKELPPDWNGLVAHDIFLQTPYFEALEGVSPTNISWFYMAVFSDERLVGIAIIQRVELYLEDIFRNYNDSCYRQKFKHFVSTFLRGNMLVVGNLMHTGQHGIYFDPDFISLSKYLETAYNALEELKQNIKRKYKKRIRIIMFKDYFKEDSIHQERQFFQSIKLHKLSVQPNMIMEIRPHWTNFDSYLSDLNKKYKQRYKVARKKAGRIVKRELNLEDIEQQSNQLYELYKIVSDNAKINTFILPKGHFCALKRELDTNFRVFGYYLDDTLIGFYTLILNINDLETYFLGYDEVHQYPNQLYLNMLYDMLDFGITNKFESVVYARTAMEIKSSVGAEPKKMYVYLKHTNSLMNTSLQQIFKLMNPKQEWEERHPFKI